MTKVYVAAPYSLATMAFRVAALLRADGHAITSTWHDDTLGLGTDPRDPVKRRDVLTDNLLDLRDAAVVVALTARGIPRATNAEIGYALALGMPVVWWQSANLDGANIFDAHELVTVVTDWRKIPEAVRGVQDPYEPTRGRAAP